MKDKRNKQPEAIKDCDKAIKLNPELAVAYFYRAQAKATLGDKKGQNLDNKKAKTIGVTLDFNPGF